MKDAGREVEPWRVPVLALRALERQLSAQPEQFTVALAAEKLLALLTPDVSAMNVAPLSGLAAVAEKARAETAPDRGRAPRPRDKGPQPGLAPSTTGSTNRFGGVSNVIGAALQRGAVAMGTAAQAGSGLGRAIAGESGSGAPTKTAGTLGKALAGAVAFPVDPARRGRDASVVPIDRKQGGGGERDGAVKESPLAAAALAAMEALSKGAKDSGVTAKSDPGKRQDGSALDTGLDAIQRVGELAGKLIDAGAEQLARPQGGLIDALANGVGAAVGGGAGKAAAPDTTLGRVDRLATDLLARGIAAGAARGVGEALTGGAETSTRGSSSSGSGGSQGGAPAPVAPSAPVAVSPPAPAKGSAVPTATVASELPDAASLTALVNEVLIEQARRHGVDLT